MFISQLLKKLCRYLQITLQNQFDSQSYVSSSLSTSTCTLSQSPSHLDKLLRTESRGSNAMIPWFMWKLSYFRYTLDIKQDLLLAWTRLWYHVKFVNHWSTGKYESCRKGIMQWNNQRECTLNREFMPQISDKSDKNCSENHNINLHSLINNTMSIQ